MTTSVQLPAFDGFNQFSKMANRHPVLTAKEEKIHAEQLFNNDDQNSAKVLILSHLRLVARIAKGYAGYGLPQDDILQEGTVGLMKAVRRFDPNVGVRLVSFASHWIKAEIHEFVIKNWRTVKIATTKAQRKLFFNLRSMKKSEGWLSASETAEIAEKLDVSESDVKSMENRLYSPDSSFHATGEDDDFSPESYLQDESSSLASNYEQTRTNSYNNSILAKSLEQLDERSRDIVNGRWLSDTKATLSELADKYGVSAERIRQLEKNAFKKMQTMIGQPPSFA